MLWKIWEYTKNFSVGVYKDVKQEVEENPEESLKFALDVLWELSMLYLAYRFFNDLDEWSKYR